MVKKQTLPLQLKKNIENIVSDLTEQNRALNNLDNLTKIKHEKLRIRGDFMKANKIGSKQVPIRTFMGRAVFEEEIYRKTHF